MSERIQTNDYDAANDILYIRFPNDRGMSCIAESPIGFEIMRDIETNELTGLVVYYPKLKKDERQKRINAMGFRINLDSLL